MRKKSHEGGVNIPVKEWSERKQKRRTKNDRGGR